MKRDNRGFSLVELIIIIAIMAILIGVLAASISRISGYRAKECRTKIVSSLENGRMLTLSKSKGGTWVGNTDTYLSFFKYSENGCNYCITVVDGNIRDVKKISKPNVTLSYSTSKDASAGTDVPTVYLSGVAVPKELKISDTAALQTANASAFKVAYSRSNGAFLPLNETKDMYVYQFFASAGNYKYEVQLHPKTGKVEVGERTRITTTAE